jgi:hypothetical protein
MLEKLVWISAFMLVGARHGGCTVGEVEAQVGGAQWRLGCMLGACWVPGVALQDAFRMHACR